MLCPGMEHYYVLLSAGELRVCVDRKCAPAECGISGACPKPFEAPGACPSQICARLRVALETSTRMSACLKGEAFIILNICDIGKKCNKCASSSSARTNITKTVTKSTDGPQVIVAAIQTFQNVLSDYPSATSIVAADTMVILARALKSVQFRVRTVLQQRVGGAGGSQKVPKKLERTVGVCRQNKAWTRTVPFLVIRRTKYPLLT